MSLAVTVRRTRGSPRTQGGPCVSPPQRLKESLGVGLAESAVRLAGEQRRRRWWTAGGNVEKIRDARRPRQVIVYVANQRLPSV